MSALDYFAAFYCTIVACISVIVFMTHKPSYLPRWFVVLWCIYLVSTSIFLWGPIWYTKLYTSLTFSISLAILLLTPFLVKNIRAWLFTPLLRPPVSL